MFMTRSVTCIVENDTDCTLRLSTSHLEHGSLDTPIPATIPPRSKRSWTSSTAGFMTGTEGWAVFEIEGAQAMFEVDWANPFIGDNTFKQIFRLLPDEGESPAGDYAAKEPSGEDLEDADDVTVTYTLTITPRASASAGGADAAPVAPAKETPPPDESAPQAVSATPGAQSQQVSSIGSLNPPRLIVALNEVKLPKPADNGSVGEILEIVAKRLEGGLDVVWQEGEKTLWDPTKWKASDPEEQWARAITELLLGLPYNGSAAIYGHPNQDTIFYKPFSDPASEPILPFATACQHNTTFGVLSRGFPLSDLANVGFSCNDSGTMGVFKGGKWSTASDKKTISKAIDFGLAPGSVYVFNPNVELERQGKSTGENKQREGSHIAFVLRVDKDQKQAQFFDTGGLQQIERKKGPVPLVMNRFASKGSYDDPLWAAVDTEYYIGMGILKPAPDLANQIKRLKRARPIGLARFVLTTRDAKFNAKIDAKKPPGDLLFVSRLLRTYGDAEDQNFTLARYLWSLRDLPGTTNLQAYWVFYAPVDTGPDAKAKATAMMKAPRTKKVDDFGLPLTRSRFLVFGARADGKAEQVQRRYTKAMNNKVGDKGPAKSVDVVEKPDAFPPNLASFVDALPPKEMVLPKDLASLPALFRDYASAEAATPSV